MKKFLSNLKRGEWLTAQSVGLLLLVLALVVGTAGYISQHPGDFNLLALAGDFYANISSELASIAITVLIIDTLNRRRDQRVEERRTREQLIRQMGSQVNEVARRAVEELRAEGWLTDGSLQEADLRVANLEEAKLWDADLQGVNLQWAKLKKANLNRAVLVGANLKQANLQAARLNGADVRGANLFEAKLYRVGFHDAKLNDADLSGAHCEGAQFVNADLCGVNFTDVFMDEFTVLPDGCHWTAETDLSQFTDEKHPHFWRPTPKQNGRNGENGEGF
jgi:uncharacterized protein YjbI with pentapeptide repeats